MVQDFSDYWGNMKYTEKSSDQFNSVKREKAEFTVYQANMSQLIMLVNI